MTIAYLTGAHAGAESIATTGAIDTTGGTLIVVGVARDDANGTLTDSKSNTWTARTTRTAGGIYPFVTPYYCESPNVGSGHTFTFTTSTKFPGIAVLVFSGTGAFDSGDTGAGDGTFTATSQQPGSITPAHDNDLVVAILGLSNNPGSTPAINSGYTADQYQDASIGESISIAHLIQTTATATNPTWSWTNGDFCTASSITFQAAASSGTLASIDGIAVANISKCQGIAKASLLNYNGLTF
jgi:hypothetical protein